jgi:hypothetical protein
VILHRPCDTSFKLDALVFQIEHPNAVFFVDLMPEYAASGRKFEGLDDR